MKNYKLKLPFQVSLYYMMVSSGLIRLSPLIKLHEPSCQMGYI